MKSRDPNASKMPKGGVVLAGKKWRRQQSDIVTVPNDNWRTSEKERKEEKRREIENGERTPDGSKFTRKYNI